MGTMLKGQQTADFVVTLKTLPVKAAVSALGNKILEELQKIDATTPYHVQFRDDFLELINIYSHDKVKVHIATMAENIRKLDNDIHVKRSHVARNLEAIKHARWYDEVVKPYPNVANLLRLMKDVVCRFQDFSDFTPWMITVVCHYCMTRTSDGNALSLPSAFKRTLQLLSGGIFLPYSAGINDPLEPRMPVHGRLPVQAQERLTATAQTLFRVFNYPLGVNYLLGLKPLPANVGNVFELPTEWDGVQVSPSISVFSSKPQSK